MLREHTDAGGEAGRHSCALNNKSELLAATENLDGLEFGIRF